MCSTEVKLTLLKTFCSPVYIAQLWWNDTTARIHKLHVSYNNVFRLLLRLRLSLNIAEPLPCL